MHSCVFWCELIDLVVFLAVVRPLSHPIYGANFVSRNIGLEKKSHAREQKK